MLAERRALVVEKWADRNPIAPPSNGKWTGGGSGVEKIRGLLDLSAITPYDILILLNPHYRTPSHIWC